MVFELRMLGRGRQISVSSRLAWSTDLQVYLHKRFATSAVRN